MKKPCRTSVTTFRAVDPPTGEPLEPDFHEATAADVDAALVVAQEPIEGVEVCAAMQHGGPYPPTTENVETKEQRP